MPSQFQATKQTICPPKSDFTVDKIPDLTGQVAVVTGTSVLNLGSDSQCFADWLVVV